MVLCIYFVNNRLNVVGYTSIKPWGGVPSVYMYKN